MTSLADVWISGDPCGMTLETANDFIELHSTLARYKYLRVSLEYVADPVDRIDISRAIAKHLCNPVDVVNISLGQDSIRPPVDSHE
jgi:hypothetical protein